MIVNEDRKDYTHALIIGDTKYLLNKNPYEYAKEAVLAHWTNKVDERSWEIGIEHYEKTGEQLSNEECEDIAVIELSKKFLIDEHFIEYYKQDGYDMIVDTDQFLVKEDGRTEFEKRSTAWKQGIVWLPEFDTNGETDLIFEKDGCQIPEREDR